MRLLTSFRPLTYTESFAQAHLASSLNIAQPLIIAARTTERPLNCETLTRSDFAIMEPNDTADHLLTMTSEDTISPANPMESAATFSKAATSACNTTEILGIILLHLPYGDIKPHLSWISKSFRKTIFGNHKLRKRLFLLPDTLIATTNRQILPFSLPGITQRSSVNEKTIIFSIGRCAATKHLHHAMMRSLLVCQPPLSTRLVPGLTGFDEDGCPRRVKNKCKMERGGERWESVRIGHVIDYVEALWEVGCTRPSISVHLKI